MNLASLNELIDLVHYDIEFFLMQNVMLQFRKLNGKPCQFLPKTALANPYLGSSKVPKYFQEGFCLKAVHLGKLFRKRQSVLPWVFSIMKTDLELHLLL